MLETNKIYCMDAIELLKQIPDNSIDMILTDPPYNVTHNGWDNSIDIPSLFNELWRVIKKKGIIIMTTQQPFTTQVIMNQIKLFRYDLIWKKGGRGSGFLNANCMPLRNHEHILIFYNALPTYNPQFSKIKNPRKQNRFPNQKKTNNNYGGYKYINGKHYNKEKFPLSVIDFERPHPPIHPTQKPLELFKYLIQTYSNESDLICDPFLGSGTTAVACKQLNRKFIGCDSNEEYVNMANKRLEQKTLHEIVKNEM